MRSNDNIRAPQNSPYNLDAAVLGLAAESELLPRYSLNILDTPKDLPFIDFTVIDVYSESFV